MDNQHNDSIDSPELGGDVTFHCAAIITTPTFAQTHIEARSR